MCTGEDLELADTVCHITSRDQGYLQRISELCLCLVGSDHPNSVAETVQIPYLSILGREYQGAELYPTLTGLNTKYREEGDKDEWFRFRIMNPKFTQISEEGEVVSETCNHSRYCRDSKGVMTITFLCTSLVSQTWRWSSPTPRASL